ncbi:MAG: lysylphosphatidylglycerol synthase transmembrane domain-containing protein [Micromonosporaceae bacterium]
MGADRRVESAAVAKRRPGWRSRLLRVAVEAAAVGAVVYFFVHERDLFRGFGSTISSLEWAWVGLAFAAELASVPALAEAQRIVLRAGGVEANRFQMNLVTLASNAMAVSVPAGVAVAEGYSFIRYRRFGAGTAVAAWSELASGAIAFCALASVALAGAVIAGGGAELILLPILAVVVAGSAGAAIVFRHPLLLVRGLDWTDTHLGRAGNLVGRLTRGFCESARSLTHVRPSVATWVTAGAMSAVNWLLDALCLAFAFAAVGAPIPWGAVLLAFAGSKVLSSVGITPGGIGVVEGGLVATFVAYGVPGAVVGAAVLVYRALTLVGLVAIGWLAVVVLAVKDRRDAGSSRASTGSPVSNPAAADRERHEDTPEQDV